MRTNLSDALALRAETIARMAKDISRGYGFSSSEAIEIVKTATISQHTDVMHNIREFLEETKK